MSNADPSLNPQPVMSPMDLYAQFYLDAGDYYDPDILDIIQKVDSERHAVRFDHARYGYETAEDAARMITCHKRIERIMIDRFEEAPDAEDFALTVGTMGIWLDTLQSVPGYQAVNGNIRISPSDLTSSMISTAARLAGDEDNEEAAQTVVDAMADLYQKQGNKAVPRSRQGMHAALMQAGGEIAREDDTPPYREKIALLERLTDQGIIPESFWYNQAVVAGDKIRNFHFIETFHRRLVIEGRRPEEASQNSRGYELHYGDLTKYIGVMLDSFTQDPARDQSNVAGVIRGLIDSRVAQARVKSLPDVIRLANAITNSLNRSGGIRVPGRQERGQLALLREQEFGHLAEAVSRIAYATRIKSPRSQIKRLEYEDRLHADIIGTLVEETWERKQLVIAPNLGALAMRFPDATGPELSRLDKGFKAVSGAEGVVPAYAAAKAPRVRTPRQEEAAATTDSTAADQQQQKG